MSNMRKVILSIIYVLIGIGSVMMAVICTEQNDIMMMAAFIVILFTSGFSLAELYIGD
jgi:uncharacterized Tic20 family protein